MQIVALRLRKCDQRLGTSAWRLAPGASKGISLLEVLIAMFIMLFGLMGVAAIFPVGSHYVVEGDKKDRSANLAQIAFEEIQARGILRPEFWLYADPDDDAVGANKLLFIQGLTDPAPGYCNIPFGLGNNPHPGHAFVIDPLGASFPLTNSRFFPFYDITDTYNNPWPVGSTSPPYGLAGTRFPVRRMTLPGTLGPLTQEDAETIFTLRDDLAQEMPESGDQPSIQRWAVDPSTNQLLARQFKGDYTWLATVLPTSNNPVPGLSVDQTALWAMQPDVRKYDYYYEVSAVVFYKRDIAPSASEPGNPGSERLIGGEFQGSGELVLYSSQTNLDDATQEVDTAVDGLKPGQWICVMGVNQVTGQFLMKWYKLLALDDETADDVTISTGTVNGRYAMVQGPDWPTSSGANLRVAILPGVIDVYTRVMKLSTSN